MRAPPKIPGLTLPIESAVGAGTCSGCTASWSRRRSACSRDELRRRLARRGIETRTFFIPIHSSPIYYAQYRGQRYPVSEELCRRGLYLPSGATLTEAEIAYICDMVREVREQPA